MTATHRNDVSTSNSKRRRLAKVRHRNADVNMVIERGVPFFDSRGVQYASLECSQPVMGVGDAGEKVVKYVINKCRIVRL